MSQVPYLAPISYVLIRTLITSSSLLIVGILKEGYTPFPSLFRESKSGRDYDREISVQAGLLQPTTSSSCIESGNSSIGLSISQSNSRDSLQNGEGNQISTSSLPLNSSRKHRHHHRPRRKKRRNTGAKNYLLMAIGSIINIGDTIKYYQFQTQHHLNTEAIQLISAGLSGMLLLPICYTTGLILTSPTVASVWDGPMIPLGCFCSAVTLGLEQRSKLYPGGQVCSLLLTVVGSIVVLLVDYLGGGHGIKSAEEKAADGSGGGEHMQFIRGNMLLLALIAAYSATALLQKRLNHYPPIQLTAWMFGIGHIGCLTLLTLDSLFFGSRLTGCNLGQALIQLYTAMTSSPTFRYGLLYSALFVGGACFSIMSYASSHLESSVITLFAALQPPITAVLEWIWEGKGLGYTKCTAMCCVLLGMHFFTYIKRVEKEIMDKKKKKREKMDNPNNRPMVHPKMSQGANGSNNTVQISNGGEDSAIVKNGKHELSPNMTNRTGTYV